MMLKRKNNQKGVTLTELLLAVVISSIMIVGLGSTFVFFIDSWQRAEARRHLYKSATFIYNTLADGYEFDDRGAGYEESLKGFRAGRKIGKIGLDFHGSNPCPHDYDGNEILMKGPPIEDKDSDNDDDNDEYKAQWEIRFFHDTHDSTFCYEYESEEGVLIPSIYTFGGDPEEKDQERLVYVEAVCYKKYNTSHLDDIDEDVIKVYIRLRNKYGERIVSESAIHIRGQQMDY